MYGLADDGAAIAHADSRVPSSKTASAERDPSDGLAVEMRWGGGQFPCLDIVRQWFTHRGDVERAFAIRRNDDRRSVSEHEARLRRVAWQREAFAHLVNPNRSGRAEPPPKDRGRLPRQVEDCQRRSIASRLGISRRPDDGRVHNDWRLRRDA